MDIYPDTYPVAGKDLLVEGQLEKVFPRATEGQAFLKDPDVLKDLRCWLVEPDVSAKQRRPLKLDSDQKGIVTSRTKSGYRRIKGPAGSGKTTVLAARAAQLASEGKSVLVVCFNITLLNFLRDTASRWPVDTKKVNGNITFLNYHGWCKRTALQLQRERDYKILWREYFEKFENDQNPDDESSGADRSMMMDERLPGFMEEVLKKAGKSIVKYDAVLVDEGQDFLPGWWQNLRLVCKEGGEMLLFADVTQDIYGKTQSWTNELMAGCGFKGGWFRFPISYRLPPDLAHHAKEFARRFLPKHARIEPALEENRNLELFATKLRWVQTRRDNAQEACLEEILRLSPSADPRTLSIPDIVFVGDNKKVGLSLVKKLGSKGVRAIHTFSEDSFTAKKQKTYFYLGDARVKLTTLHSFKGMETRSLVMFISNASDMRSLSLIYTGLTRVKRHTEGSFITIVSTCSELLSYGKTWPDFVLKL